MGQIAKIKGCRVVGVAGSAEKVEWLTRECGFDAAFDYKATSDYSAELQELCTKGIDVYFDNAGGPITHAVVPLINTGARISICGQISQYNNSKLQMGPRLLHMLIVARAKMQGFLVTDYAPRFAVAGAELGGWYRAGRLKSREDIVEGFENLPKAFIGLFKGENTGKRLVKAE